MMGHAGGVFQARVPARYLRFFVVFAFLSVRSRVSSRAIGSGMLRAPVSQLERGYSNAGRPSVTAGLGPLPEEFRPARQPPPGQGLLAQGAAGSPLDVYLRGGGSLIRAPGSPRVEKECSGHAEWLDLLCRRIPGRYERLGRWAPMPAERDPPARARGRRSGRLKCSANTETFAVSPLT